MPPRTRAGSRTPRYRLGYGRQSDNKIAWLRTFVTDQLALLGIDASKSETEEDITLSSEVGISYILVIPVPGRKKPLLWNLSGMTTEELEATRQFFNHLFNLVDPVVRERDKVANDAYENEGDDSYTRLYRDVPQFVVRERPQREYSQGIHDGPEDDAPLLRGDGSSDGSLRDSEHEVVDGVQEASQAQDDRTPLDEPEGLR